MLGVFVGTAWAAHPHTTLDVCAGPRLTAKGFTGFSAKVWKPERWRRGGELKAATIASQRRWLQCARGPGHARAMRHRWRADRRAYREHRRRKLKQRERLRYLPFECGGGVRSAIPCYIPECESENNYRARNATSTAGGRYQIIDKTWLAYGGKSYADSHPAAVAPRAEQDRIAAAIYADVGSSAWVCA